MPRTKKEQTESVKRKSPRVSRQQTQILKLMDDTPPLMPERNIIAKDNFFFPRFGDIDKYYYLLLEEGKASGELKNTFRELCKHDLFFLLTRVLKREDVINPWLYDRCCEIQRYPNGYIDLWAREHYKSTIITFAKTIQDILCNPNITVGIFSFNRPIAKQFLGQIKREFERNDVLKNLFDDILFGTPEKESPKWSEDGGIIIKRYGNPKEATVEAYGLVDSQPTSKHYQLMVYDDVITRDSVSSPEMIDKVTHAWELSRNLAAAGGATRYIGTRYHLHDTYAVMMDRKAGMPRLYPATLNGEVDGTPVLIPQEKLLEKRREMGSYTFACQMLLNPIADSTQGFKKEWLKFWKPDNLSNLNIYITVDPASEKKKHSDYTAIVVIGIGADDNFYVIDIIKQRYNLTERIDKIFELHRRYRPLCVGYEKAGMQCDNEYLEKEMERRNYRFNKTVITEKFPKNDRIKRLVPYFENGQVYLPDVIMASDDTGNLVNIVNLFIRDEFLAFPASRHDDVLDAMSMILHDDMRIIRPGGGSIGVFKPKRKRW